MFAHNFVIVDVLGASTPPICVKKVKIVTCIKQINMDFNLLKNMILKTKKTNIKIEEINHVMIVYL